MHVQPLALRCATDGDACTFTQRIVDVPGHLVHGSGIDQWADGDTALQAVADLELSNRRAQAFGETLVDAVLHQDAVGADAGLPGVAKFALHDPGDGQVQIGVVEHNERRVAPQFQAQALDGGGALAHQQLADPG
ncbi:hypothetical protein D3C73_986670 [compost metagenome]